MFCRTDCEWICLAIAGFDCAQPSVAALAIGRLSLEYGCLSKCELADLGSLVDGNHDFVSGLSGDLVHLSGHICNQLLSLCMSLRSSWDRFELTHN